MDKVDMVSALEYSNTPENQEKRSEKHDIVSACKPFCEFPDLRSAVDAFDNVVNLFDSLAKIAMKGNDVQFLNEKELSQKEKENWRLYPHSMAEVKRIISRFGQDFWNRNAKTMWPIMVKEEVEGAEVIHMSGIEGIGMRCSCGEVSRRSVDSTVIECKKCGKEYAPRVLVALEELGKPGELTIKIGPWVERPGV